MARMSAYRGAQGIQDACKAGADAAMGACEASRKPFNRLVIRSAERFGAALQPSRTKQRIAAL
jgi:hypothetical protein